MRLSEHSFSRMYNTSGFGLEPECNGRVAERTMRHIIKLPNENAGKFLPF